MRAQSYGFPGAVVDGNDVEAVHDAALAAVERARAGEGPTLIEAKTFRVRPHSAATPNDARSPELIRSWEARDPIAMLGARLVKEHDVQADRLEALSARAASEVEDAVEFALASPAPEPESATEDVYAPSTWTDDGRLA